MDVSAVVARARSCHRSHAWQDACEEYAAADRVAPLDIEDLERYAEAAHVLGHGDEVVSLLQRAYQTRAEAGNVGAAARCAFWLHDALCMRGEFAQAGAWLTRAARLGESQPDCAELGYLLLPQAERQMQRADYAEAYAIARRAHEMGEQCGDRDLIAAAVHLRGRARIKQERVDEGLALLDEAMLSVTAGECSSRISGTVYCNVIASCRDLHELRRAREWTAALNSWVDTLPQFTGAYSGICRVHRSELLQLNGAWPDAVREAERACDHMTRGYGEVVAGMAFYQLADIHRLRGELEDAEKAYRQASQYGWDSQPGLAMLWLNQGRTLAAARGIRRALAETLEQLPRARLLPAYVDIMLALGDIAAAREATTELADIARAYDRPALYAQTGYARAVTHLAEQRPEPALGAARRAWRLWRELDVPYEAARARIPVALACRALGDDDTASMELDAAHRTFKELGAVRDRMNVELLRRGRPAAAAERSVLSPRELEVLRLVAAGKSNQAVARELFLSEKTVARHVSNIFAKLNVGSRTAAAAYAFEHHLV